MQGNPARKVWEKHLAECLKVAGDCFPKYVWRRNTAKRFVGPADNPGVKEHPERRMLWQRIINSYVQRGRMWGAFCFYAVQDYSKDLFQIKCCAVNWKCVALPVCFFPGLRKSKTFENRYHRVWVLLFGTVRRRSSYLKEICSLQNSVRNKTDFS